MEALKSELLFILKTRVMTRVFLFFSDNWDKPFIDID